MNPLSVAVIAAVLVLALGGMAWSWRRRRARQGGLSLPAPVEPGAELAAASGTLLATTFAGRPLDRVVAAGLGFRAAARVAVHERALVVERAGSAPMVLPLDRVRGAGTGTWALDRGVERGGLTVVAWSLDGPGGEPVDIESAFRLDAAGQAGVLAAIRPLVPVLPEVPHADR